MKPELTVFVEKTPSYRYSGELQLSYELLQNEFPGAHWLEHQSDSPQTIKEFVDHYLPSSGYVLFVREPALLVGKGTLDSLKRALNENHHVNIVMPSDIRGANPKYPAAYLTLFGFDRYVAKIAADGEGIVPFDGRLPWMFLATAEALHSFEFPEDPFSLPLDLPAGQVAIAYDSYIHPFLDYYHETREDVLPFVPGEIESLLDIGCARGNFGASVKSSLNCRVAGVEMNPHEAAAAMKVLDKVWIGDFLSLDIEERFDCISCLDVLEHLPEPETLLENIHKRLKPHGKLLLSVPNVGHWSIIEDLLSGRWDYAPAGTLCITHLRFYTKHSLQALLEKIGFNPVIIEAKSAQASTEQEQQLAALKASGIKFDEESLATYQYIVLAEKK